jgi:hypothetical protein
MRLADHYRKANKGEEVARVLKKYGEAFRILSGKAPSAMAVSWIEKVHEAFRQFGLRGEAEALEPELRRHAERSMQELATDESTITLQMTEVDEFLAVLTTDPTLAIPCSGNVEGEAKHGPIRRDTSSKRQTAFPR